MFLPGESQGRGAWWAAIYGVTKSQTRLKWLSSSSRGWAQAAWPQKCPITYFTFLATLPFCEVKLPTHKVPGRPHRLKNLKLDLHCQHLGFWLQTTQVSSVDIFLASNPILHPHFPSQMSVPGEEGTRVPPDPAGGQSSRLPCAHVGCQETASVCLHEGICWVS